MRISTSPHRAAANAFIFPLLALCAVLAPSNAFARVDAVSLEALNAADLRLASVSYKLGVANADRCAAPEMQSGLILHDLGQYGYAERPTIAAHYRIGDGIGVVGVVPGSVAAQAGLRAGDEIVMIDGKDVRVASADLPHKPSYDRVEDASRLIRLGVAKGTARLSLRRAGETFDLFLTGVASCGGETVLAPSQVLNAWSDGLHVVVTTRLLALAGNDDELAFIVAHEMSHNNLHHQEKLGSAVNGLFSAFGRTASRIKETEIEADTSAIGLMAAAGYRLDSATAFLKRAGKGRLVEIATTHPGTARRVQIVSAAIQAVTATANSAVTQLAASKPQLGVGTGASSALLSAIGLPADRKLTDATALSQWSSEYLGGLDRGRSIYSHPLYETQISWPAVTQRWNAQMPELTRLPSGMPITSCHAVELSDLSPDISYVAWPLPSVSAHFADIRLDGQSDETSVLNLEVARQLQSTPLVVRSNPSAGAGAAALR